MVPQGLSDAAGKGATDAGTVRQVLHVRTQELLLCIDLGAVERVLPLMALKSVPGGPEHLVGLMNLQGQSVPVFDVPTRLGEAPTCGYTLDSAVVLCRVGAKRVGLMANAVVGVGAYTLEQIQMSPEFAEGAAPFVAVVTEGDELSLVIDLERLIAADGSLDRIEALQARGA